MMTKIEAIAVMKKGEWVTHQYFSDNERMTIKGEYFLFEDGETIEQKAFWNDRRTSAWLTGFEVFKFKNLK